MWPIAATLMHKYKQLSLYNFSYSPLRQNARLDIMNFICWNLQFTIRRANFDTQQDRIITAFRTDPCVKPVIILLWEFAF